MSNALFVSEDIHHKPAHPIVFFFLSLPYGITTGYATVALEYLFTQKGMSTEAVAALVSASLLPNIFKFFWAPMVDAFLTLKKWYVWMSVLTAVGTLASGVIPIKEANLPLIYIIIIISNVGVSFTYMSATGLAALDTPHHLKGKVGGYNMAGNLGGAGLGGGLGLWLWQHVDAIWVSPLVLALIMMLTCIALIYVKEPKSTVKGEKVIHTLENLFKDILNTVKTKMGFLALFLCFLPLGTGAVQNLWASISGDWKASADTVAFATGIASGLITAGGCLIGGWICDRMDRQKAYILFGLINALCCVGMAYSPHTEWMYIVWTSVYALALGFCYAAFSAFVFEAIGKGAAGTKYTIYSSLSNIPLLLLDIFEGWIHDKNGPIALLNSEAIFALIAIVLFVGLWKIVYRKPVVA